MTYRIDRLKVRLVGHPFARLHGCNVRVDQHDFNILLFERFDGLGPTVVELAGLPDGQPTRPEQQHLVHDGAVVSRGRYERDARRDVGRVAVLEERLEEERRVHRPAGGLGVELHREDLFRDVDDALIGHVVGVHEHGLPARGQGVRIDGVPVVLRRNVAPGRAQVDAGLVHAAVAVLHLVRLGARGEGEDLVPEADAKDGLVLSVDGPANGLDAGLRHGRVARTVGDEDAVPLELLRVGLERVVVREEGEAHAEVDEVADDIEFDAAVKGDDVRRRGIGGAVEVEAADLHGARGMGAEAASVVGGFGRRGGRGGTRE